MALFKPFRGTRASLPQELHDGYAYFCTDDGSFHIDYTDADGNLQRKQVCGNITLEDINNLIGVHNIDTEAHNDIRTSIDNVSARLDIHDDIIDNSVMINKSFGNGPDTVAEGDHIHGDLELQIRSIEDIVNADYNSTSGSVEFFTDITPSHTVWYATSASSVTDVDIIGGRYVCTTSTADQGLKTDTLDDIMNMVRGKTIVAAANLSSENYTLYVKMYDGSAWSFGRVTATDKIITVNVPENITKFRLGLEYGGDGSAPDTCEMTNFALYLVNDVAITSTENIPNRNYTIWSWNDEEITNPEAFASFCNAYKINRVYQHISTSTLDLEAIRKFVGTMQKNRISVNWLTGDPSWALTDHQYHIVDQIQKVVSYNMSIQNDYEKIGTIQFDIEPYTLDEWATDQASVIKQYQDAVVLMYNESIAKQISLNVCVASWFDGITYDNEYGQGNLFDFVSKHSSSTVIMAYNTKSYVSIAEDEIRMGALNGKNVAVGLETHAVTDSVTEDITFANKPIEDLYRAFETLFLVYKMYGVYKGYEFIIHDYAYFKAYAESFNLEVVSNDILGKLNTTDKTDLISAINEINTEVKSLKTKVPQPDWNVNDENADGYVKNRTHYDDSVVICDWDGDISKIDDIIYVDSTPAMYRIGDCLTYTAAEVQELYQTIEPKMLTSSPSNYEFQSLDIIPADAVGGHGVDMYGFTGRDSDGNGATPVCLNILSDNFTLEALNVVIPKKGMWLLPSSDFTVLHFSFANIKTLDPKFLPNNGQSDWSVNDKTSPAYIKNRTHYEAHTDVVVVPETEIKNRYSITLEDVSMLKVGAQCVVTIDGVKYETTIRENVNLTIGTGVNTYDIGIGSWMHLNMSPAIVRVVEMTDDCPFALLLNDNSLMFVHEAADATNDTHKVGVCVKNYELKKLDAKYLPDNIATTEYVNSIAASKPKITTVTLPAANWTGATNPWSQEVTINGLTATCKIDPQLTALQIVELQNEEITLMFQNDNGVATAWAIGNKPTEDYTLQILLTEVEFV